MSYSFDKENYCIDLKSNFFNLDLSKDLNGKVLEIINNNKITTVYHLADIVAELILLSKKNYLEIIFLLIQI